MEKFREQFDRFYAVLEAKEKFSFNCLNCPIRVECEESVKDKDIEEIENGPTCEESLLSYILTGELPK